MNNISIIGRMGKDVDLTYSKDGKAIGKFSVGVTRKFNKDVTDWFNCTAFGKTAEIISQYLGKGNQIGINGEIQFGKYDNKDGATIYTTTLVVNSFDFCGGNKEVSKTDSDDFEDNVTPVQDGDLPF